MNRLSWAWGVAVVGAVAPTLGAAGAAPEIRLNTPNATYRKVDRDGSRVGAELFKRGIPGVGNILPPGKHLVQVFVYLKFHSGMKKVTGVKDGKVVTQMVPTFHDFLVAYGQARIDHPAQ